MSEGLPRSEFQLHREDVDHRFEEVHRTLDRHEEDLKALRTQRNTDQDAARETSRKDREWTWTRVIGVFMAAATLIGLELQYLGTHR